MKSPLEKLLDLAVKHAPQGADHDGLEAVEIIADARRVIESEPTKQAALDELVSWSRQVEADICDQDTGWFYQWVTAARKAQRFTKNS